MCAYLNPHSFLSPWLNATSSIRLSVVDGGKVAGATKVEGKWSRVTRAWNVKRMFPHGRDWLQADKTFWIATACGLAMTAGGASLRAPQGRSNPVNQQPRRSRTPARRAQDATQWRSRVERGIGCKPTKPLDRHGLRPRDDCWGCVFARTNGSITHCSWPT